MSTNSVLGAAMEGATLGSWRTEGPSLPMDGFTERWTCAANLERKTGMTRGGAVQRQGGMTTPAPFVSSILTRPDLSFRKTGLVLRCPKGREAS